jgi:hypothetical protein
MLGAKELGANRQWHEQQQDRDFDLKPLKIAKRFSTSCESNSGQSISRFPTLGMREISRKRQSIR